MTEAPPQRPLGARVERKGRFTITEITPGSPQEDAASAAKDVDAAFLEPCADAGAGEAIGAVAAAAAAVSSATTVAVNQAIADTLVAVVVEEQQQQHAAETQAWAELSTQQMAEVSPSPPQTATTTELQPQSPKEGTTIEKASAVVTAASETDAVVVVSSVAVDDVVEPEPSPVLAAIEIELQQPQPQLIPVPVPVDHVFIEYDNDDAIVVESYEPRQQPPGVSEEQPSPAPAAPQATLAVDVSSTSDAVVPEIAADATVGSDAAASLPAYPEPAPESYHDSTKRHEHANSAPTQRAKRKSRFTITDVTSDAPAALESSNELFAKSYSTSTTTYSADFSLLQFTSSEFSVSSANQATHATSDSEIEDYDTTKHYLAAFASPAGQATAAQGEYNDQYQLQVQQQQQQQQEQEEQEELDMQRLTRSMPSELRSREGRRAKLRSVSPIRPAPLAMNDLVRESSDQSPDEQPLDEDGREELRYHRERAWSTVGVSGRDSETNGGGGHSAAAHFADSSSSTRLSPPVSASTASNGGGGGVRRGLFAAQNGGGSGGGGSEGRRHTVSQGNGFGSGGRRHASSRQKSITISAAQFLQQQQTIAALIRQQQELKHIIGVLQEQQQQLMSVPVQLHELRLENAKGDGKDEMMRELYVQVDSLMRANDSLQVLVSQAEKETQDRAQEAEYLTEENDQLRTRCHYFERKYIEERKLTFVLEEEVQRFRMMSLTHELEQRNSMSHDAASLHD